MIFTSKINFVQCKNLLNKHSTKEYNNLYFGSYNVIFVPGSVSRPRFLILVLTYHRHIPTKIENQ